MSENINEASASTLKLLKAELALIEPQYLLLKQTIESLEALLKARSTYDPNVHEIFVGYSPSDLELDFSGLTLKQAALQTLKLKGSPMTTREIADAIEATGFEHGSANFWNTVNTSLVRLRDNDEYLLKNKDGKWELTMEGRKYLEGDDALLKFE